jgi:hypothetical protein
MRIVLCLTIAAGMFACTAGQPRRSGGFGGQLAVISPHDEPGGRFDGARLSPGFGVLFINGYTPEGASRVQCEGYFGDGPDHLLEVSYAMSFKVVIHSADDLLLAVRGPGDNTVCGEPPSDLNENTSLTRNFEPGVYEIWIGSPRQHTSNAYRLVISE